MAIETCNITVDRHGQELVRHGTSDFPVACYQDDLSVNQVPWHWHEELEAVIVTEGALLLGCGSEQYAVHAGEGFFINSGIIHGCWDYNGSHCRIHSIVFHPRLIGGTPDSVYFQKYLYPLMDNRITGSLLLSPKSPWQAEILRHIESAWQSVHQEPSGYEFEVWHHLSNIILLLHHNLPTGITSSNLKSLRDAQRIKVMLQFIHEHYAERITVAEIANRASISDSECLRCFRATLRLTPIQYLRQYRIQQASNLLRSTQETVSTIAHACGFDDLSFFAKTFRALKGVAPSQYRDNGK